MAVAGARLSAITPFYATQPALRLPSPRFTQRGRRRSCHHSVFGKIGESAAAIAPVLATSAVPRPPTPRFTQRRRSCGCRCPVPATRSPRNSPTGSGSAASQRKFQAPATRWHKEPPPGHVASGGGSRNFAGAEHRGGYHPVRQVGQRLLRDVEHELLAGLAGVIQRRAVRLRAGPVTPARGLLG